MGVGKHHVLGGHAGPMHAIPKWEIAAKGPAVSSQMRGNVNPGYSSSITWVLYTAPPPPGSGPSLRPTEAIVSGSQWEGGSLIPCLHSYSMDWKKKRKCGEG